jgi:uncharacterized protein
MLYPRFLLPNILDALADSPVVLINGARQTGKTTLAKKIAAEHHPAQYLTLDDLSVRGAAQSDPHGFLNNYKGNVVIDEIQLVPALLPAIKLEVDQNRQSGRFLLTGSANVLALPQISESLAGRIEILTLFPFSQGEIVQEQEHFIDWIFKEDLTSQNSQILAVNILRQKIVDGGYPEVIKRTAPARKEIWFRDYITTIVQRDIRDLANINGLTQMPRLLELLSARLGSLLNFAELSRSMQIPQTSLKRYMALFQATYLIQYLPSWSSNIGKRLVKMPKLYFSDTGVASYLLGATADSFDTGNLLSGQLLENFVLAELLKQSAWNKVCPKFFHFRTQSGIEVDFILEDRFRNCVGIEVKTAATVRQTDFKGLERLQYNLGNNFIRGIVMYLGTEVIPFGEKLYAVPVSALWQVH